MNNCLARILSPLAVCSCLGGAALAQTTGFTYQGRLNDRTGPASGSYDLVFTLHSANTADGAIAGPVTNTAVAVTNGLFTTLVDFGPNIFTGGSNWLELAVRTNGASNFATLAPRQQLSPVPLAQYANSASNLLGRLPAAQLSGSIPATNLSGTIPLAQLPEAVLTNGASGVAISGTFSGDGSGVTNVNLRSLNSGGLITGYGNFYLASSPYVADGTTCGTTADVNGDGYPDLIFGSGDANNLTVLLNNGNGTFRYGSSPNIGGFPTTIAAADVNGDGSVDLITASSYAYLTILTNTGSGTFATASSPYYLSSGTFSLVAVDVNGDGYVDLVTGGLNDGSGLTVLTNNGRGNFTIASQPTLPEGSSCLVAADVNGDGYVDLINMGASTNILTILTNTGSGNFLIASRIVVGSGACSVAAVDVNGDGYVDLVTANSQTNTLTVLINNGNGSFSISSSPVVAPGAEEVAAADWNGDGAVDLLCLSTSGGYADGYGALTVLTNNGAGGFATASTMALSAIDTGVFPSLAVADFNGDGHPDFALGDTLPGTASVYLNTLAIRASVAGDGSALTGLAHLSGGNAYSGDQYFMNGNVGIGTRYPGAALDVESAGFAQLRLLENGFDFTRIRMGGDMAGINQPWDIAALDVLNFYNAGYGNVLTLDTSGNARVANNVYAHGVLLTSDRNAKENFAPLDSQTVLAKVAALPVSQWNYKADAPDIQHIGPMAQDFQAAFGLDGGDDKHISVVDEGGVALAAIQGLNQKLEQQLEQKETEIAKLQARLERMEKLLNQTKK